MTPSPRPTRYRSLSPEAEDLLSLGESGRCEFKRDADAVQPKVLATLANWVALDPTREVAQLLVGVDDVEDKTTGLVRGVPCGLPKGLERAVARLQDMSSRTKPIPVDMLIIEENVDGPVPFLRVEIRPSMAPHFDDEGRRQTRQGRSTRALTDEELLRIYLDREAGSFADRFRLTSREISDAVGSVGDQVDQVSEAIQRTIAQPLRGLQSTAEQAADAADNAAAAVSLLEYEVSNVGDLVRGLDSLMLELQGQSAEALATRASQERRRVWLAFTIDTWDRTSRQSERLEQALRKLLERDIAVEAARNAWEVRVWSEVLATRERRPHKQGSLKWWGEMLSAVTAYTDSESYRAPDLPDLRGELRADVDAAVASKESQYNQFRRLLR